MLPGLHLVEPDANPPETVSVTCSPSSSAVASGYRNLNLNVTTAVSPPSIISAQRSGFIGSLIFDQRDESAFHVLRVVAVEKPRPRIVRYEFDVVALHVSHRERVAHHRRDGPSAVLQHGETVAVQVHRVVFHAHVEQPHTHTVALFHN